jgi:hypothetical protein
MNAAATKERIVESPSKADTIRIASVCAAKFHRCRNEVNVMHPPSKARFTSFAARPSILTGKAQRSIGGCET